MPAPHASPTIIAYLTVPLALSLMLAETAVGSYVTVLYLRARGGLTRGFLKFMAATYAVLGGLALLAVGSEHPGSYRELLAIQPTAAGVLVWVQAVFFIALLVHAILVWRGADSGAGTWGLGAAASAALVLTIAATLAPLGGSALDSLAIAAEVALSAVVLGAATTGMLLGHWYLVTPALTNRPLLRSIAILLVALLLQAVSFPFILGGLQQAGSLSRALSLSPVLTILWGLGAVVLPLLAAGLALPTCRLRSFMSTTGLLYLAMIAILPGQLLGQLLFFVAAA